MAHTENAILHMSLFHIRRQYRVSCAIPPNWTFQRANCATGPITRWNTNPGCQPHRGPGADIHIQQHFQTDSHSIRRVRCSTLTIPGTFAPFHLQPAPKLHIRHLHAGKRHLRKLCALLVQTIAKHHIQRERLVKPGRISAYEH
jgi:hypothetical protein